MTTDQQAGNQDDSPKYSWTEFWMLVVIALSLVLIFLLGLLILVNGTSFKAAEVVAVLSPALAAVGTVAGGIFGYSIGARNTSEAQTAASKAAEQATSARQDASTISQAATPLGTTVQRISSQARQGGEATPEALTGGGKYAISKDDLLTLEAAANRLMNLPQVHA